MAKSSDFKNIEAHFERLYGKHGYSFEAIDYGRKASQEARFRVISAIRPLDGLSLLDVGCGFADYADFLDVERRKIHYTGIDLTPSLVEEARRRHPRLAISVMNILEMKGEKSFDIVNANGIFYLLREEPVAMMQKIITRMFGLARLGIVFSSLSMWAPTREADEFYADPLETLSFCRTLTPWVVLRHDYLPHDFTIYASRDRS